MTIKDTSQPESAAVVWAKRCESFIGARRERMRRVSSQRKTDNVNHPQVRRQYRPAIERAVVFVAQFLQHRISLAAHPQQKMHAQPAPWPLAQVGTSRILEFA